MTDKPIFSVILGSWQPSHDTGGEFFRPYLLEE